MSLCVCVCVSRDLPSTWWSHTNELTHHARPSTEIAANVAKLESAAEYVEEYGAMYKRDFQAAVNLAKPLIVRVNADITQMGVNLEANAKYLAAWGTAPAKQAAVVVGTWIALYRNHPQLQRFKTAQKSLQDVLGRIEATINYMDLESGVMDADPNLWETLVGYDVLTYKRRVGGAKDRVCLGTGHCGFVKTRAANQDCAPPLSRTHKHHTHLFVAHPSNIGRQRPAPTTHAAKATAKSAGISASGAPATRTPRSPRAPPTRTCGCQTSSYLGSESTRG